MVATWLRWRHICAVPIVSEVATLVAPRGLRGRILNAASWTLSGQVVGQAIRFGGNLLTTRLLMPEAFGLMAVASMLMTAIAMFSDIGINKAVIRSQRGTEPQFLHTAWTMQVVRGICLSLVGGFAALGVHFWNGLGYFKSGTVYSDERLPWVIFIVSLSFAITGLSSVKIVMAARDMKARLQISFEVCVQIVTLAATLLLCWYLRSIWALLIGGVIGSLVHVAGSHFFFQGPSDRFLWDRAAVREIFSMGRWIFLSSIFSFMAMNLDRLLLGGLIEVGIFGVYSIATMLIAPFGVISSTMIGRVIFPSLSEVIREQPTRLGEVLQRFQRMGDLLLMSTAGILIVAGPALIGLLYDHRYTDAGWMLSILAIGLIGTRVEIMEQCYLVLDKTFLMSLASALRAVTLLLGIPLAFSAYGLQGGLAVIAFSKFAGWPVAYWFCIRMKLLSLRIESMAVLPLVGGLALGFGIKTLLNWLP